MYSYNFTKEKMHKIMYLLEDKTACFHEKTKAIYSMVKQKQINNKVILRYINKYLENIDLEFLNEYNDIFYLVSTHQRNSVLNILLKDENINNYIDKDYCIYFACMKNQTKNVELLLKAGANINAEGHPAFGFVLTNKNIDILKLLLENENYIKNKKIFIKTIFSSKWYTAINCMIEYNTWLNEIDNDIISQFKDKKLFIPVLKKIKLKQTKNKIEVF